MWSFLFHWLTLDFSQSYYVSTLVKARDSDADIKIS